MAGGARVVVLPPHADGDTTMMTVERWRRITEVFHSAMTREAPERAAFVTEACGSDTSLADEVRTLLAGHQRAESFGDVALGVRDHRLASGDHLGSYRVDHLIDAGGMGEVYRARDTKLNRDVAIKVLPAEVAADADRLARFTREAQLLAALNHPHIAAIYGLEHHRDVQALVLELVDGQTLARRLQRSRLSIAETLQLAHQIADALAYAHARGIVHRDLKPANLMIGASGGVKVLDFGLAKVTSATLGTLSKETREGVIAGTVAYMSPEQARGWPVDKQTDIWAFGCVLFEMLSGHPPFRGASSSDVIAAVLEREPEWSQLPAETPQPIQKLIRRCLKKNPADRLHDIADAKLEIADAPSPSVLPVTAPAPAKSRWRSLAIPGTVIAFVALVLGYNGSRTTRSVLAPPVALPSLELAVYLSDVVPAFSLELSPDGRRMAMGVLAGGRAQIWTQALDGSDSRSLTAAEVWVAPFWSPDGGSIAYVASGKLWRMPLGGGPAVAICDAAGSGSGSWNSAGEIIFAATGQLFRVGANGGTPKPVSTPDPSGRSGTRTWPQWLPNNRHFIYHVTSATESAVYVGNVEGDTPLRLVDSIYPAKYVAPGYVLFIRGAALMALKLHPISLAPMSYPMLIARDVAPGYLVGVPEFSASPGGLLAYVPTRLGNVGRLTWFDRSGRATGHIDAPTRVENLNPAISPAGDRVAVNRMDPESGNWDVWTIELGSGLATRLTDHPAIDADPVWAPDGQSIVYQSDRDGSPTLYRHSLNTAGPDDRLIGGDGTTFVLKADDWSRDGRLIIFEQQDRYRRTSEILALPLSGDRTPRALVRNGFFNYGARLSPDGQWVAYNSNQDGAFAIHAQHVDGSRRTRLTSAGGVHPRWTSDGKQIIYSTDPGGISIVDLAPTPSGLRASTPKPIVVEPVATLIDGRTHFDVTNNGERILMRTMSERSSTIKVLVNWTEKLPH